VKSGLAKGGQKGDDFVILHPLAPHFVAGLAKRYAPVQQKLALILEDIFVQDVHAGRGSSTNSSVCLRNASPDNVIASAIVAWVMLWWHRSMMVSQAMPSANISITCQTMMRVPRKVGLP
jgi:hypothetical protein